MLYPMKSLILMLLSAAVLLPATTDAKAEKDVLAALEAWKQACIHKDKAAFDKIYHSDLTYGHSSGLMENKAQAIQHMIESKTAYVGIDFADTAVRVYGNAALVTGKTTIHEKTADGKMVDVNLSVLYTLLKGPQGWQMVARQATRPTP
jgi:ketosteroid isomerase-like protein